MYTRVVVARVGFATARIGLGAEKFVPRVTEVCPARTWAGRFAEHSAFAAPWFATIVLRVSLAFFAIYLFTGSFSLAIV